jgi:predicted Zn-dependent protease with MMP-like domain
MEILLSDERLRNIFKDTFDRLPKSVKVELDSFVTSIGNTPEYILGKKVQKYVYGAYTGDEISIVKIGTERCITLYENDCLTISNNAVIAVIAHELGHAYCHITINSPSSDAEANRVASAWGFKDELAILEHERQPIKWVSKPA